MIFTDITPQQLSAGTVHFSLINVALVLHVQGFLRFCLVLIASSFLGRFCLRFTVSEVFYYRFGTFFLSSETVTVSEVLLPSVFRHIWNTVCDVYPVY